MGARAQGLEEIDEFEEVSNETNEAPLGLIGWEDSHALAALEFNVADKTSIDLPVGIDREHEVVLRVDARALDGAHGPPDGLLAWFKPDCT